jgi:class 3 adenylate cyclase
MTEIATYNARLTDRLLDGMEEFLRGVTDASGLEEPEPDRVLATILFTDIVGSSERAASLGTDFRERGLETLKGIPGEWHLYAVASGATR